MNSPRYKGSVTVFLSMIMLLLMSMITGLVEVVAVHNMKSYKRISAEGGINSVFAEYHSGLQENFGLFGLDTSYESGDFHTDKVMERWGFYGGVGESARIDSLQLITDNKGTGFLDQVILYMKDSTGLSFLEDIVGLSTTWESLEIEEDGKGEGGLGQLASWKDSVDEELENPLADFMDWDWNGILNVVVENKSKLSDSDIDKSILPSERVLEVGFGSGASLDYSTLNKKLILNEYVLDKFTNACELLGREENMQENSDILNYQVEYIIGGKNTDVENLKAVVHKLLLLRTPINYACLQGDSVKKAEVQVLATTVAVATGAVGTESIIEEALLWSWSYGESMADVKSLLSGNCLQLNKASNDWQLDLSSLLKLGSSSLNTNNSEEGLDYKAFLRILLFLEDIEDITLGAMDMVEMIVRAEVDFSQFQLDHCISRLKLEVTAEVGLGYTYSFPIEYGYR